MRYLIKSHRWAQASSRDLGSRLIISFGFLLCSLAQVPVVSVASSGAPIVGVQFDSLLAHEQPELQAELRSVFSEFRGYQVLGPLDPLMPDHLSGVQVFRAVRILCPDLATLNEAVALAKSDSRARRVREALNKPFRDNPEGFRGVVMQWTASDSSVVLLTPSQNRWLIWARDVIAGDYGKLDGKATRQYADAVSDYLYAVDLNLPDPKLKPAQQFGLPEGVDLYATDPPYVIEGYENYVRAVEEHAAIHTDFAHGVRAFLPTDSLRHVLIDSAPRTAYPNKEAPVFQEEMRKFEERGGDLRVLQTLTAGALDTLPSGEYFFAVGLNGDVRFGRELPREEVERLEKETGRKLPRANHSFLFPGSPILTAGAFFVERDPVPHISLVNAHSGHYFYSNVSPTIHEDLSVHSDDYLLTLGHFLGALERLGIPTESILISKM